MNTTRPNPKISAATLGKTFFLLAFFLFSAAAAQAQDAVHGATLYRTPGYCISCHGDPPDGLASLAAGNVAVLNNQIATNPSMQFLSFLSQQDRKDIVAYIADPSSVPTNVNLSVFTQGSGSGTVSSSPAGITSCSGICGASYAAGTVVTLTASPNAGSTFVGWGGSCSGNGSCNVTLNSDQTASATFNTIPLSAQAIQFGAAPSIAVGGSGSVTATGGGSGNPVTFTSQTTAICTVSGSTVTGVAAGTCTILANQAGNSSFSAATQTSLTFTISASISPQTITFAKPADRNLSQGALTLAGTASSGLAVSYASTTQAVCAISSGSAVFFNPGTCSITASQAGNGSFSAASSVTQSFAVSLPTLAPLSTRGGIDLDGNGKAAIPMRSASATLTAGRYNSVTKKITFTSLPDPGSSYRLIGIADFDGNGKSDLAFQALNSDPQGVFGDVHVWTDFNSATDKFVRTVKLAWLVQVMADEDGDGKGDMTFRFTGDDGTPNDTGVSYIWFFNPDGTLQVRKRGGAPLSWTLLGGIDLNYDGAADMVYISPAPGAQIRALMATPGRTCANLSAGGVPDGFTALKLADFTGNQRGDILIHNSTTGETQLLSLNGSGLNLPPYAGAADDPNASCTASTLTVTNTTINLPTVDPTWQFFAAGDFDGDGITDIVWKQTDGTLNLWLMKQGGANPTVVLNVGTAPAGFTVVQP